MNTSIKFRLRISPEAQLANLVALASGLLANEGLTTYRHPATAEPLQDPVRLNGSAELPGAVLVAALASQVFEELRSRVEADVDEHPKRYTGLPADQMPIE
jgi:hypothetical protein